MATIEEQLAELRDFVNDLPNLKVPEELAELLQQALEAPPIEDVEEWAAKLSKDICAASVLEET